MTIVKICGITNLDDAMCAAEAGTDMLGFIFYPRSPRYVTPERVREIVKGIRDSRLAILTVGVFVNELPSHILSTLSFTGIDYAQLSGDESAEHLRALAGQAYKAVRSLGAAKALMADRHPVAISGDRPLPDLLLDADHATLYGGSGVRADESLAAALARECRLLLAGGLKADNVAEAIQRVHPWGVDVASGVEASPGKKDHSKVLAFIQAARKQDQHISASR